MIGAINKLGLASGHVVSADRCIATAELIMKGTVWTVAELDMAEALIATDAELAKQISFDRSISFGVFALAKNRDEVRRGRLHSTNEARNLSREKGVATTDLFEAVTIAETGEKQWRMK